jgi:excisionase family DNA binding protein
VNGHPLAVAVVEALAADPVASARLRSLLAIEQTDPSPADAPAYTVDSLAATLKVTARVIRNAIARGELRAVKRGRRWIISGDAVRAWTAGAADAVPVRSRAADSGPLTTAVARLNGGQPRSTMPKP